MAAICSSCAILLCDNAGRALAHQHLGVGVAGGAQCIGHALRAGGLAHPDYVTVATDMRNTFSTIHRTAVLKAVAGRLPKLFAFVTWAYSVPAELWVHGRSTTGVRQGGPLRPFMFSLGMQDVLDNVERECPDVLLLAYLVQRAPF